MRRKPDSLVRKITLGLILIYLFLLLIMTVNNAYAVYTMRQNVYNQLTDALSSADLQISTALYEAGTYLAAFYQEAPNLSVVEQNRGDSSYYTAIYRLQNELSGTLRSMTLMDGLFAFPVTSGQFIYATDSNSSARTANLLMEWVRGRQADGTLDSYVGTYWFSCELDGRYYLVRILKIGQSYLGAWTDYSALLSCVRSPESLDATALFSCDGAVYDAESRLTDYPLPSGPDSSGIRTIRAESVYIAADREASYTQNGRLWLLVRYHKITGQLKRGYLLLTLCCGVFLLSALPGFRLVQKYLQQPLRQLSSSLDALRNGDFSIRLPETHSTAEFTEVNSAFNLMVDRIETLKINVYEEQLLQQKTSLQMLKNQIAPHFLINCLNSIYHLSSAGRTEDIQRMTVCLGEHLRYVLADVSVVPLHMEQTQVKNYVDLSGIRFPGCISLSLDADPGLADTMVPPMILLFQVENIVKYEVVNGELTEIHIEIRQETTPDTGPHIHITIWDTGTGYDADVLHQLRQKDMPDQTDGHNIGTRNICQRLQLMFPDRFSMEFSNRRNAGAQVDIRIPCQNNTTSDNTG